MVHDLSNQFLAIFKLDQRVDSKLDVLALADIGQVLAHTYIVQVDLFKQIVETSDDIEVALFETIIQIGQLDRVIDHPVELVLILNVLHIEENLEVLRLL